MRVFNFKDYTIVAQSWETRNAWGHTATILQHDNELSSARVRYYNRTWERYRYQSVILEAIDNLIATQENRFIEDYKSTHNIKRLKKEQREALKTQAIDHELMEMFKYFDKGEF